MKNHLDELNEFPSMLFELQCRDKIVFSTNSFLSRRLEYVDYFNANFKFFGRRFDVGSINCKSN